MEPNRREGSPSFYPTGVSVTYSRGLAPRHTLASRPVPEEAAMPQFGEVALAPHEYVALPVADMPEIAVSRPDGSISSVPGIVSVVKAERKLRRISTPPGYIDHEHTREFVIADPRRLPTSTLMNTIDKVASLARMSVKDLRQAMHSEAMVVVGGRGLLEENGAGDEVLHTSPSLKSAGAWGLGMETDATVLSARKLMGEGKQYVLDCRDNIVINAGWLALHANVANGDNVRPVLTIYGGGALEELQSTAIGSLIVGASTVLTPRNIPPEIKQNLTAMARRLTDGGLRRQADTVGPRTHVGPDDPASLAGIRVFTQPSRVFSYDTDE